MKEILFPTFASKGNLSKKNAKKIPSGPKKPESRIRWDHAYVSFDREGENIKRRSRRITLSSLPSSSSSFVCHQSWLKRTEERGEKGGQKGSLGRREEEEEESLSRRRRLCAKCLSLALYTIQHGMGFADKLGQLKAGKNFIND